MRSFKNNLEASAVPLVLFLVTIFACGALYSLFFLEIGFPFLDVFIPASDSKTFIMMMIYAIPLFVVVIGVIALLISGLKERYMMGGV